MKNLIVLVASVMLGIFLFNMIAGSDPDSTYSQLKGFWQTEVDRRTMQDY